MIREYDRENEQTYAVRLLEGLRIERAHEGVADNEDALVSAADHDESMLMRCISTYLPRHECFVTRKQACQVSLGTRTGAAILCCSGVHQWPVLLRDNV